MVHPFLMLQIPSDGFLQPFFELQGRLPSQAPFELGRIDGVPQIVSCPVRHVCNQSGRRAFRSSESLIRHFYKKTYQIYIFPFVEATYIVSVSRFAFMEDDIYGSGMIHYIQPIAYIFSLPVNRQRFIISYIVDKQRYQFFRELIRTVIVAAISYDYRHPVGIPESAHEMIRRGFGCRVRTVGIVFGIFRKISVSRFECAIYLIRGNMIEQMAYIPVFVPAETAVVFFLRFFPQRQTAVPPFPGGLKQSKSAYYIRPGEYERILDAPVHMTFRSQMDDIPDIIFPENLFYGFIIADIPFQKSIIGTVLYIFQIGQIPGVSKFVEIINMIFRIFIDEQPDHMGTYKSRSPRNQYIFSSVFHINF